MLWWVVVNAPLAFDKLIRVETNPNNFKNGSNLSNMEY